MDTSYVASASAIVPPALAFELWGNWQLLSGLVIMGCALWLVCGLDYDRTLDRTTDDDYYWLYPRLNKGISVVKQLVSLVFFGILLAALALSIWNHWAPRFGWPPEPELPTGAWGFSLPPPTHSFWRAVALSAIFVTLFKAKRALVTPRYDLFISYRSKDAHVVRQVADQLIASSGRVWFAEYEVLLQGREKFQQAIDAGLSRSARVLAFTNDVYADSEHCRHELEHFLKRASPARVIEIKMPAGEKTHRFFPQLRESTSQTATRAEEVLAFLKEKYGWPIDLPAEAAHAPTHFEADCLGRRFRLDTSGWEPHASPGGGLDAGGNLESPTFRREVGGGQMIFVNLVWGPEPSAEARRRHLAGADDREMYNLLLDYVDTHIDRVEARVRGVHLLFHGGLSQMCVTYWTHGYWTRKHSVVLPHPKRGDAPAEFVFTFGFNGPFKDYCRHAYLMDRLVLSLEWR